MKNTRSFFVIAIAIIALSVINVSAQNFAASAGPTEQQVLKKIRYLPNYSVFDNITVSVNGGTVTLGGKVISLGTKGYAENVVQDIPGVTRVVNNIDNLPPSSFDDRIRRAAYLTFVDRGPGQYFSRLNPDVRIIVENGRLTLEGYVRNSTDSNTLNILAHGISGVFTVTNNLVVGRRA